MTGDKRRTTSNHVASATRGELAGETGQPAARSLGDETGQPAARSLGDSGVNTVATADDGSLSVPGLLYVVVTTGCLLLMMIIVGAASYAIAARR